MTTQPQPVLLAATLLLALAGCQGREHLNEWYGMRGGGMGGSINGTSVLGELFEESFPPPLGQFTGCVGQVFHFHRPPVTTTRES